MRKKRQVSLKAPFCEYEFIFQTHFRNINDNNNNNLDMYISIGIYITWSCRLFSDIEMYMFIYTLYSYYYFEILSLSQIGIYRVIKSSPNLTVFVILSVYALYYYFLQININLWMKGHFNMMNKRKTACACAWLVLFVCVCVCVPFESEHKITNGWWAVFFWNYKKSH